MAKQLRIYKPTYIHEREMEAVRFIQKHQPPEGYMLGQSGGKDSAVLEWLTIRAGARFTSVYAATGVDPPQVVSFIKRNYPKTEFVRPPRPFLKELVRRGYPTIKGRWCCDYMKHLPKYPMRHRLLGMRAEESPGRATYGAVQQWGKNSIYLPILDWREWEIWELIEWREIPYCKLYDEGFSRLGCVVCPFICHPDRKAVDFHMKKFSGIYKAFERSMYELWERKEHHRQRIRGRAMLFEEFLDNWYRCK